MKWFFILDFHPLRIITPNAKWPHRNTALHLLLLFLRQSLNFALRQKRGHENTGNDRRLVLLSSRGTLGTSFQRHPVMWSHARSQWQTLDGEPHTGCKRCVQWITAPCGEKHNPPALFLFKPLAVISMKLKLCGEMLWTPVAISSRRRQRGSRYRLSLLLLTSNTQSNYRYSHVGHTV